MDYIRRFPEIKRNLKYGVIYILTRFRDSEYSLKLFKLLKALTGYHIEVIESPKVKGTTLMVRRINVGNSGKDAVLKMSLNDVSLYDIQRFADSATDVLSAEVGDKVLECEPPLNKSILALPYEGEKLCSAPAEPKREIVAEKAPDRYQLIEDASSKKKLRLGWPKLKKNKDKSIDSSTLVKEEIIKEDFELLRIERQQQEALLAIQAQILDYVTTYHADPSELIQTLFQGKFVISNTQKISPLLVNNDLKIVLPHYNEVEVKMPAMCRTIYILFLLHPEGIALRNISDYRNDLENIYSMVMPGRDEELAQAAINNLLDPMSNTLNEYISKIKRCFKAHVINDSLASHYLISGKRGEPYKIALAPELITLPQAVKSN